MMIRYEVRRRQRRRHPGRDPHHRHARRLFGLAAPLITRQVRNSITADLHRLRDRLET